MANAPAGGRPLRFLIVGAVNTLFGLAIYPALLWILRPWGFHYMAALLPAQAISLCFAFTLHKLWVFRTDGALASEFVRFASFYLGIYALNWAALPVLVEVVGIAPWLAQFGFVLATVVGSYFFHSAVTFRARVG